MKLKIYEYKNCGTCRKALKFLTERKIPFMAVPIREQPPTRDELKKMLNAYGGDLRKLFNTSGQDYRNLNLKNKLAAMTAHEAIELLAANGNLVKRPFVLTERGGFVGFEEKDWSKLLGIH